MESKIEEILDRLFDMCFVAECYNGELNGVEINNLLCLGDVRDVLESVLLSNI